ncbi:MAG: sel1 repeat family protein, partial [Candidatus Adiutrix sp.]|nr:sel1 repeat family protein [Candidatus Adiutrix sp.]
MRKNSVIFALILLFSAAAQASASPAIASIGQGSFTGGLLTPPELGSQTAMTQAAIPAAKPAASPVSLTPQQAVEYFTKQAEAGQAPAMYNLGTFYENGLGTPRNFSRAVEWYLKAGEAGQAEGYHQAGIAYALGRGVEADRDTAMKYLELAAAKKVPTAAYQLAALALAGPQKEVDSSKALKYLKNLGLPDARAMEV